MKIWLKVDDFRLCDEKNGIILMITEQHREFGVSRVKEENLCNLINANNFQTIFGTMLLNLS